MLKATCKVWSSRKATAEKVRNPALKTDHKGSHLDRSFSSRLPCDVCLSDYEYVSMFVGIRRLPILIW